MSDRRVESFLDHKAWPIPPSLGRADDGPAVVSRVAPWCGSRGWPYRRTRSTNLGHSVPADPSRLSTLRLRFPSLNLDPGRLSGHPTDRRFQNRLIKKWALRERKRARAASAWSGARFAVGQVPHELGRFVGTECHKFAMATFPLQGQRSANLDRMATVVKQRFLPFACIFEFLSPGRSPFARLTKPGRRIPWAHGFVPSGWRCMANTASRPWGAGLACRLRHGGATRISEK